MTPDPVAVLHRLPGGDLVAKGIADLDARDLTIEALLVLVAGPALRELGLSVRVPENRPRSFEHALYDAVEAQHPQGAHSAYNALIRRIASFVSALRLAQKAHKESDGT